MTRDTRLERLALLLALGALAWAIGVYMTDGFRLELGGLRLSSRSPRMPLALAAASFSWMLLHMIQRQRHVEAPRPLLGRPAAFIAVAAMIPLVLNVLLMSGPMPPEDEHHCVFTYDLGARFHHYLNCDAPEFLALAQRPSLVLGPNTLRQSRPLSFGLPYLVAAPLRLTGLLRTSPPYAPFAAEYLAFAAINLASLVLAMVFFTRLVERTGTPPGIELFVGLMLLGTNELTRPFLLNPHVQIYNLFMPCLSMYLVARLLERRQALGSAEAVLTGLTLGVGILIYGSFVIPVLCAALVQLVFRAPLKSILLGLTALIPYALWVAFVLARTGEFQSAEMGAYRQFVWILDCAKAGVDACTPMATKNASDFFSTTIKVVAPTLALMVLARVVRGSARPQPETPAEARRVLRLAIGIPLVVTTIFLGAMGFYVWRLSWAVMPPLLLILTLQLQSLRRARPAFDGRLAHALALAALAVGFVLLLNQRGPYS